MKAIIASTVIGIILMFSGLMIKDKKSVRTLAVILLAALFGITIWEIMAALATAPESFFNDMLRIDRYSLWFNMLMAGCTLLYVLLVGKEIERVGQHVAEYFALISFILCGVFLLTSYNNM